MNDLLPADSAIWQRVEAVIQKVAFLYGYEEIRVPLLERTELFKRSIGEVTDIVEKEMYTFLDNSGESITLRPEATASCVRAGIEHGLFHNKQVRVWYMGPMFRYERPQKGRFRQFHQFGIEAYGWYGPDIDAEIILFADMLWKLLQIDTSTTLEINSLGTAEARKRHRTAIVQYFEKYKSDLDNDSRHRLYKNPLRILDSKNPDLQNLINGAPLLMDYLTSESEQHFEELCIYLSEASVDFRINHRLVRGLDYYTGTVFEWVTDCLGAQNAICAGGRYDGLVESLGGRRVPGAGFALGIERLIEVVRLGKMQFTPQKTDAYICSLGSKAQHAGFNVAQQLRSAGISATVHCGGGKLGKQLRKANQLNAALGIIIGESELLAGTVVLKNMREDESQVVVLKKDIVETAKKILNL